MKYKELIKELEQFIGTTKYHRCTLLPLKCTDGVAYFATNAEAFWLLDEISIDYFYDKLKGEHFVVAEVEAKDNKATLTYSDGNYNIIKTNEYDFTDLEDGKYKFYLQDEVLMLPSEY